MEEGDRMRKFSESWRFFRSSGSTGTIGAVEQDMLPLGTGTLHMIFALACFYVFCKLAGAFDPYIPEKKKSRPRCSRPESGKRKAQSDYIR